MIKSSKELKELNFLQLLVYKKWLEKESNANPAAVLEESFFWNEHLDNVNRELDSRRSK